MDKPINVTKSFLPQLEEYINYVRRAFKNEWLTNRGELVLELEQKLASYLKLEGANILLTNNGTLPLQIALKLLGKGGEVITTPFSYVATTAAILWEGCSPIFVDIHPEYLTIDESKIESAITPRTTCILATHVYGNPCNIEKIDRIGKKHRLKVIYDAAHCFGVKYMGKSIFEYGDLSTCSFHATKIFHTGEGGAIFCNNKDLFHRVFYSHNFGHKDSSNFYGLGINAKISELQAGMGLAVLPYMDEIIQSRKKCLNVYLKYLNRENIKFLKLREGIDWNFSYFPIVFKDEKTLLKAEAALNLYNIFPRRYFYPSLNKLPYLSNAKSCKISESISERILCLPLFHGINPDKIFKICDCINNIIAE